MRGRVVGALAMALAAPAALVGAMPAQAETTFATVTGVITDSSGAPVQGVCVSMPWVGTDGSCSDATGAFSRNVFLEDFEDSVTLIVAPAESDLLHAAQEVTVTRASGWRVDVVLPRLAVVTGRALSATTGKPLEGVCPGIAGQAVLTRTCSGADGVWSLWRVTPGTMAVSLSGPGYQSTYVPSGQRLAAARTFTITPGYNTVPDTKQAASATVISTRWLPELRMVRVGKGGSDFVGADVDNGGEYLAEGGTSFSVQPGKYKLAFLDPGDCWSSDEVDVCDDGAPVWYPGTFDPGEATPVQLRSGQTLTYDGVVPSWRTPLVMKVKGLPTGTRIVATASFLSGAAWEAPLAMVNGYAGEWATIRAPYLPPTTLKLHFVATKPNGSKVTWWYGGKSFASATPVGPTETTITTAAPGRR